MNEGRSRMGDFHNCYFSYDKPNRFPTTQGLSDGLIYWAQRMRLKKEFKDTYLSFFEEAKKRFLRK